MKAYDHIVVGAGARPAACWRPGSARNPILLPLAPGAGFAPPAAGFLLVAAAMTPDSRGTVRLASPSAPPP